jgi:hypothetical protein
LYIAQTDALGRTTIFSYDNRIRLIAKLPSLALVNITLGLNHLQMRHHHRRKRIVSDLSARLLEVLNGKSQV